jgi:hypothetical protein
VVSIGSDGTHLFCAGLARSAQMSKPVLEQIARNPYCGSLVVDQIPEAHPALAVEPHQLQLLDRIVMGRTGADFDAGQQHRQLEVAQVRRLAHDILAREIVARLFEHLHQGGRRVVAVDKARPNGARVTGDQRTAASRLEFDDLPVDRGMKKIGFQPRSRTLRMACT